MALDGLRRKAQAPQMDVSSLLQRAVGSRGRVKQKTGAGRERSRGRGESFGGDEGAPAQG